MRKPLFVTETIAENRNQSKAECGAQPHGYIYKTTRAPKSQEPFQKKRGKCPRIRVCGEIVSPRNVRSYIRKVSTTRLPKDEQNKDGVDGHAGVDRMGEERIP